MTVSLAKATLAIPRGEARAITMAELARRLGTCDGTATQWATRRIVRALDLIGVPVVTSHKGVWLATNGTSVREYVRRLKGRVEALELRIRALQITAEELDRDGFQAVIDRALP